MVYRGHGLRVGAAPPPGCLAESGVWEEKIVPGDCFFGCRGLGCEWYGLVGGFIRWPYG